MAQIKVLIVDDSALVRQALKEIISEDNSIQVIGASLDPIFAMDRMKKEWPDVIILDIEMPRMDGITFLKKIMQERPTPVIICSSLTGKDAQITFDALSSGALTIITKPKIGLKDFFDESKEIIINAIKSASKVNMKKVKAISVKTKAARKSPLTRRDKIQKGRKRAEKYNIDLTTDKVVAIGTSAGGTQALEVLLSSLPLNCPGLIIVQHMPEKFTTAFANRLNQIAEIEVREAKLGDRVLPGRALIAPGNYHLTLKKSGAQYIADVADGPLVSRHRPSVDVLFRSVAKSAGKNALGIIMTGMGGDGALGMLEMHNMGATTIAQDEETCVVFGMPNEAIKKGGVDKVVGLPKIKDEIMKYFSKG